MTQNYVSVVFDRKKNSQKRGKGKIELYIRLNRACRKYLTIGECTPKEWKSGKYELFVMQERLQQELRVSVLIKSGEELTLDNLNKYLGIEVAPKKRRTYSKGCS